MKTWFSIKAKANAAADQPDAEVTIYDEIGLWGVTAKDFIAAMKASGSKRPLVRINSPGGSVFDGVAIANYLRPLDTTIQIDGIAASMASYIATAGKRVQMADNAFVMIHNPWGVAVGDAQDMREQADLLAKLEETLATGYQKRSGKTLAEVKAWMADETWFSAEEAKAAGLVDTINEGVSFSASINKFGKAPQSLRAIAQAPTAAPSTPAQQTTTTENTPQNRKTMKNLMNALALAGLVSSANLDDDAAAAEFNAKLKALLKERDDLKAKLDEQAKASAEAAVDTAVKDGRITADVRDQWVATLTKDSTAFALLAKLPAKPVGANPVGRSTGDGTAAKTLTEQCIAANTAAGAR